MITAQRDALQVLQIEIQHYLNTGRGEMFLREAMNQARMALNAAPLEEESELERMSR